MERSLDPICETLRNRRRRLVVRFLCDRRSVAIRDLAEYVAARENEKRREETTYDERKRVRNSLYQHHLPKMANLGVIGYDRDGKSTWAIEETDELLACLDCLKGGCSRWAAYFVGLAGLEAGVLLILWTDIHPLVLLPDLVWATAFVASFVLLTLATVQWN